MAPKNFIVVFSIFLLIFAFATLTIYRLYFLLPPDLEPKPPPSDLEALTFSSLSKEESEVMRKGGVEAAELATKIAVPLSTLVFEKGCETKVSIIRAKAGSKFSVKNLSDGTLNFTLQEISLIVYPGEEKTIRLPSGLQLVNYTCQSGQTTGSDGVILVTENR